MNFEEGEDIWKDSLYLCKLLMGSRMGSCDTPCAVEGYSVRRKEGMRRPVQWSAYLGSSNKY